MIPVSDGYSFDTHSRSNLLNRGINKTANEKGKNDCFQTASVYREELDYNEKERKLMDHDESIEIGAEVGLDREER